MRICRGMCSNLEARKAAGYAGTVGDARGFGSSLAREQGAMALFGRLWKTPVEKWG